ncbi:MAG: high-affinity branched-chain amino acid ABC transporter permease LivM [Rhodospirillales bacterium]|nr:high-affinity branched-chain amino acid ABC transporter permease LivM [Rhodospirillales bacterium]MSP80013.1 high-affinity branched-chain amino acid ABC transporter permease LivM [Rhodospirillales bacterium]
MTGLLVFGLAVALVGVRIQDGAALTPLLFRFDDAFTAAAAAAMGRLGVALLREGRAAPVLAGGTAVALAVALAQFFFPAHPLMLALLFDTAMPNWLITAFAGFLALSAGWRLRRARAAQGAGVPLEAILSNRDAAMDRIGAEVQRVARYAGPLILLLALALPLMPFADRRLIDVAILVVTYIMLGWGLNIVVGLAGLLDLGYVAFYAVGAYAYALLAQYSGLSFWICLPFAGIMAAFAGLLLGFPVLRLRGDYLAIVTLGFGEMIRIILLNWYQFTGGPNGLSGVPRPSFFGLPFTASPPEGGHSFHTFVSLFWPLDFSPNHRVVFLYYVILAMAMITNLFTLRIRRLPIGRAWEALREDEIACRSLGINPTNTKLTAFAIGAGFAGFAGSFFAARQGFVSPESFSFIESAVILAIVVLGGMGSQIGVVLAAVLLIGLPEFFRDLHQYRMVAFGAAMVAIMLWRPAGLLAHREPTMRLKVPAARGGGT